MRFIGIAPVFFIYMIGNISKDDICFVYGSITSVKGIEGYVDFFEN